MIVTDLDGTLLQPDQTLSSRDYRTLVELGEQGICRVIATGRSLFSARLVLDDSLPLDYFIFSSGAGILDWKTGTILKSSVLPAETACRTAQLLIEAGFDFMVQDPIPDNHRFFHSGSGKENPDFEHRKQLYGEYARPLDFDPEELGEACQFVVIVQNDSTAYNRIEKMFPDLKVIRATSPLDGRSIWVEIFPADVSKGNAAQWICEREGIDPAATLGIGNDYNDLDLLQWAGQAVVMANAPEDLKEKFETVRSNRDSGFSMAVRLL
jgi:Cof subfamily protein (haloacid dehalogenase superfamily)